MEENRIDTEQLSRELERENRRYPEK